MDKLKATIELVMADEWIFVSIDRKTISGCVHEANKVGEVLRAMFGWVKSNGNIMMPEMSANKELDEIQRGVTGMYTDGWVAVTVGDNGRTHVSGPYAAHDEAAEATKWNVGVVSICPIRYKVKKV